MSIGDIMNIEIPLVKPATPAQQSVDIASCCPLQKLTYENCFQKWYVESFLQLKHVDPVTKQARIGCVNEFDVYRKCVRNHIATLDKDVQAQISDEMKDT